ncbi:hypothetical protein [Pseudophaeobacter sp.]|uniref:hypothetical protein n=1 Tax=Pseudophaeobacter sp. TaxID=1971739 RepID=UPI003298858B
MTDEYIVFEGSSRGASCDISGDDYEKTKRLRKVIVAAFSIEEAFSLAARSYIDLEKALMSAGLEWSLENNDLLSHTDFFDHWREVINLKLLSLLTAGGAYTEKMERLAKSVSIPGFDWDTYDPLRKGVFDADLYYRVMCALRNFSIHEQLPISGFPVTFKNESDSGRLGDNEPWRKRLTCCPHIRTQPLIASGKIRPGTRNEIEELKAEGIDLKIFTRGYVESLFKLHRSVRELTETPVVEALNSFSELEKRLSEVKGGQCKTAYVGRKGEGLKSALYIDTARLSRIQGKRQDWRKLEGLRRRYISSEIIRREGISLGSAEDIWIQS